MRIGFLALLALVATSALADDGWGRPRTHDGVTIETRDVDGSPVHELRVTTHAATAPAVILATLWRHQEYPQFVSFMKRVEVLRDEGDSKLVYEQIRVPLLKDRDVVVRVTRHSDAETGTCEMTSVATTDEGPPQDPDYVRVRDSAAHWQLAPAADGGTDVTYAARTNVGGFVPAWIVNVAQKDSVPSLVRAMLARAAERRD